MPDPAGDRPRFTVIVPVHGQWALLPGLLTGLSAQEGVSGTFEVLIAADDAPGEVPPLDLPAEFRIVQGPFGGSYAARNAAADQARGDWLVFTDADCRPDRGWLAAQARAVQQAGSSAEDTLLAGPVRMLPPPPGAGAMARFWASYDLLRGIPQERYVSEGFAATANLAIPRSLFDALGGFDARRLSGGDADLCHRARRRGARLHLIAEAILRHPCRDSFAALATKARRVKAGQVRHGSLRDRRIAVLRSLTPPLRQMLRFLRTPAPPGQRMQAIAVLYLLWGVELMELVRLALGAPAERR